MITLIKFTKELNKLSENYLDFTHLDPANNILIKNILDKSDHLIDRVRILFKNKHELSIIRSKYTYGGSKGLFEIMALTSIPNISDYDEPIGYCNISDLNKHIKYIGTLPTYIKTKELPNDSSHK